MTSWLAMQRMPILALCALTGCIHVKIEETRHVAAVVAAGEGVALVAKPQQQGVSSESEFLDCLENQLGGARLPAVESAVGGKVKLIPHQNFIDSVYPWLEPSTVLIDGDFATTLLARPGVRERVAGSGVRYVIAIDGGTNVVEKTGSMSCAIGPGGGGCVGVLFWKKQSGYQASIWDLQRGLSLGTVGTDVSGNSVFIGALLPLPFVAPVQSTACKRMANELLRFLGGSDR